MALYDQDLIVNKYNNDVYDDDLIVNKYNNDAYDDEKEENVEIVSYLIAANGTKIDARIVFQRALEEVKRNVMGALAESANILNAADVQWILTVPATWSNYAKGMMKEAAERAGIKKRGIVDHLLIATEPECASITARNSVKELTKVGRKYMLLDLGGGTVDIACHRTLSNDKLE
eukprot:3296_1